VGILIGFLCYFLQHLKASWTESKPILERDPQKRASNPDLEPADKEKLFRDHVKSLYEVRVLLNCNPYQIKFSAFSATRSEQNLVSRTFSAYLLFGWFEEGNILWLPISFKCFSYCASQRCVHDFKALLAEALSSEAATLQTEDGKTALNSWSTAKQVLKPDIRYSKMPRQDREVVWRRYVEDISRKQRHENYQEEKQRDYKT